MRFRASLLGLAGLALACGKKAPEVVPTPETGTTTTGGTTNPADPGTPANPGTGGRTDPNAGMAGMADLVKSMQETIYFDYNEEILKAESQAILDRKATIMLANPALRIRVAGHADDRGSDEYNVVLASKRATAAKRYLESKGIDAARVEIISYGEERPADTGETEAAWAKNRRDEFEMTAGGDRLVKPQ